MPNHITNILTVEGDNPQEVLDTIRGEEPGSLVDFNRIIPMPDVLKPDEFGVPVQIAEMAQVFCGKINLRDLFTAAHVNPADAFRAGDYGAAADVLQRSNIAKMLLETKLAGDLSDDDFEILLKYMRAYRQFGHCSWYSWSIDNWDTKWNAYRGEQVDERTVKFRTAWSMPESVFLALSRKFPERTFWVRWADEDFGSNTGDCVFCGGEVVRGGWLPDQSETARANAKEVLGYDLTEETEEVEADD